LNNNKQINNKSTNQIFENNFNNERFSFRSNLHKVYWSKTPSHKQLIKKDLIEYYDKISKFILPYIKDRPLSLNRYPDGITGKSFYHKNWNQSKPPFVQTVKILSKTSNEGLINYVICNNKETLLWVANLGCIEIHPWNSRINYSDLSENNDTKVLDTEKSSLNFPDFIIIDLDPFTDLEYSTNSNLKEPEYSVKGFKTTVEVALNLKELLDDLKIRSYVKTSGKTGLHIFIPIENFYTFRQVRSFTKIIGDEMKRRYPNKITLERDFSKRTGKILFDYNQNIRGKTLVSIFSPGPVDSASVSFPVEWEHLSKILPTDFTLLNVPDILNSNVTNAWTGMMNNKQDLRNIFNNDSR